MLRLRLSLFAALLVSCLTCSAVPAHAQRGGGGGRGGGSMGIGPGFSAGPAYTHGLPHRGADPGGGLGGLRTRPQLGPLGRWWDDRHFAKDLKLRPDQQGRMDSIFEANRPALARGLEDLQLEQNRLDAMYRSKSLDEGTLYAQIDRVSQARAELGKLYAHFQLQLRAEMGPDQLSRLDEANKAP